MNVSLAEKGFGADIHLIGVFGSIEAAIAHIGQPFTQKGETYWVNGKFYDDAICISLEEVIGELAA